MSNFSPRQGHNAPATDAFGILYCKILSIKNYEYKLFNARFLFSLSTAKIHILSHITKKNAGFSVFFTPAKLQAWFCVKNNVRCNNM